MRPLLPFALGLAVALSQCTSSNPSPSGGGVAVSFDLHADLTQSASFWDFPYPSDLRLLPSGAPDVSGFPNDLSLGVVSGLKSVVGMRTGFPMVPVAYFKFDGDLAPHHFTDNVPALPTSPVMLLDVDAASSERGKLIPIVLETPPPDHYVPDLTAAQVGDRPVLRLLAVAPHAGVVLHPKRQYAFVVMRTLGDAGGAPLSVPKALSALDDAQAPAADPELRAWKLYQPMWATLRQVGVDTTQVAAATVFTTGDPVQDTFDMSTKALAKYSITITGLQVRQDGNQMRNCELTGKVTYPQFQGGTPPFDTDGVLKVGTDGTPIKQRDEDAPIGISFPQMPMPASGYPLIVYFHGSGGVSTQLFDRGAFTTPTVQTPHQGPAYVMAPHGFAMAGSAMPVNPERLPGATDLAYINFNNLASFPGTFVQGAIEQRLFIDALSKLTVDPTVVASCTGLSLPMGATAYKFDTSRLLAQGQSMGGQYANMVGAIEPKILAMAPSGAGGLWSYVVITTHAIDGAEGKTKLLLGTTQSLTFLHPALSLLQTAWEPADAIIYMPRLARRPLVNHPVRSIYEPVGKDDEYFSDEVYDAMALAYGHKEGGDVVWPTMQDTLKLEGRDGLLPYPISQDLMSESGTAYTGAAIQYAGDGLVDSHYIFQQLDAVKYQYGCFFETFFKKGVATIPAPAPLGTPCPGL